MTSLLYTTAAIASAVLATRAWTDERRDPHRVAFLALGWCIALAYFAFAASLFTGLHGLRIVYMLAGGAVPVLALWCVDRVFPRGAGLASDTVSRFAIATLVVVPSTALVHLVAFRDVQRSSVPEVICGIFAAVGFAAVLYRLWEAHEASALRVEKARLRYLLAFISASVVLTFAEHLGRAFGPRIDAATLVDPSRGELLQGPLPPVSLLVSGISLYFLYHTVSRYRLLDLHELFSRFVAIASVALLLALATGGTLLAAGAVPPQPQHAAFQLVLASLGFLAAYDPLRDLMSWWTNRLLNQRGQQLAETLDGLRQAIPTGISREALTDRLLVGLHASGRVPVCSIYLWDPALDAFTCAGHRGTPDNPPLARVSAHPFTDGFLDGQPWFLRGSVARRARTDATAAEVLTLMDAMHAHLTLPFLSGGVVLGWMHLQDEAWSDGFSADEVQRLAELAGMAGVVLSNIQDFQELEERNRLVAIGQMAAGLAHEIRNPLAGIKGAAQFLQAEALQDDAQDMLQVVVDEVNRLNLVVTQFLDYARPFELDLATDHLNAIATQTLTLLRAQGVPDDVALVEDLAGDLPALPLDGPKLAQVVLNLVQNALQAMPNGGTLTVSTRQAIDRHGHAIAELAVADTGVGIAPGDLEKLFIPFFTTKENGTGLGLPICHRIVDAHGGELDVQARDAPRGAVFTVRVPIPTEPG